MLASTPTLEELTVESAGLLATTSIPIASPTTTARELRTTLVEQRFDYAGSAAVCDGDRLQGIVTIEDMLAAPEEAQLASIMDADPPSVAPGLNQEHAAWKAVQHGESALAVIDDDGRFRGLIPPARLLSVLLREHDEDIARFAGVLHDTTQARTAMEEPITHRLWHRLPWLFLGLLGAVLAADIVGAFESQLEANVLLALFVPGIVYLADAVGTQTEALIIRGLSVGVSVRSIVFRELATGAFAGLLLGAVFLPIAWIRWGDGEVAFAVALALFAACATATVVAMALPWAFHAVHRDPAFGSGPLATVIQDLLSIILYFTIAVAIVG